MSTVSGLNAAAAISRGALASGDDGIVDDNQGKTDANSVKTIRQLSTTSGSVQIEIELAINREFLPEGELLVLRIGEREFSASRYPENGDTTSVTFTLSPEEFAQLPDGAPFTVPVRTGPRSSRMAVWKTR